MGFAGGALVSTIQSTLLQEMINGTPYLSYAYGYPHKMAYRPLQPPLPLRDVWQHENRDALFLYWHIPFCEMRCGFCNLFTTTDRQPDSETQYLNALERQARVVREALGPSCYARMAVGGGTPTFLSPGGLHRLFDLAANLFGAHPQQIPVSVETSPQTSTAEKLRVLRERGVQRISMGVQSFVENEVHAVGRAQKTSAVREALDRLRGAAFPILNLDLMYGLPGQTVESWRQSLQNALHFAPEEIYLYPLYVRPLTGIQRRGAQPPEHTEGDIRLQCYRMARELLLENGYRQVSMRMFQSERVPIGNSGPVYCCQQDGMVGLGCGARSYTSNLHYSSEYAVGASGVRAILDDYNQRPDADFTVADYGFVLDADEQRRRYLVQSLLQVDGLDLASYHFRFGSDACDDWPGLRELEELNLADYDDKRLRLNARGIELSDVIGPWFNSAAVNRRMEEFSLR
jgi:oxygen-independent coproporphyrinogen-3 oxidase